MTDNTHYADVSLLLLCQGTNGSTTFTDNSGTPKTMTAVGNAQISTARGLFAGSSGLFDGVGDYLTTGTSSDLAFGTGDFTVEAWVYQTADASYPTLLEIGNHTAATGIAFITKNAGNATIYSGGFYCTKATTLNAWNHIAWVRASGVLSIFVNGSKGAGVAFTNNLTDTSTVTVGCRSTGDGSYAITGNISNLRVTKGYARYLVNFSVPTSDFATKIYYLSGNISESSAITNWRVCAIRCADSLLNGTYTGTVLSGEGGTTYSIPCDDDTACIIVISAKIDYAWSAGKVTVSSPPDYVVAANPDATPHIWKCTTAGTTHATTEPTWNLSGTTTDNTTTWTYVAPLPDRPLSLGPKIPA